MGTIKRIIGISGATVFGVLCTLIFMNSLHFDRGKKSPEWAKSVLSWEKSLEFFPWNDLVYSELGKSYLDYGISNLNDQQESRNMLGRARSYLRKSIEHNPFSHFSHFYLGQTLLYLTFLDPQASFEDPHAEFEKAAFLAAYNSEIYFEVGKLMLSRWPELTLKQKDFAIEILGKLPIEGLDEKFLAIMRIWKINVNDISVMQRILPKNSNAYRQFAEFLGKESLSLHDRHQLLAWSESMKFDWARSEYETAEQHFNFFRLESALMHYQACLNSLKGIRFYQSLYGDELIDEIEWESLFKNTYLRIAKCLIELHKPLKEVNEYLQSYLEREDIVAAIHDLESYLMKYGIIGKRGDRDSQDLSRLLLEVQVDIKQNRYWDIVNSAPILERTMGAGSAAEKKEYSDILMLIGQAYQKVDSLYEAENMYLRILDLNPRNLEALLKLKATYSQLNNLKARDMEARISAVVSPKKITSDVTLTPTKDYTKSILLDGRPIILSVRFDLSQSSLIIPLISIYFNQRIIWEGYLSSETITLLLHPRISSNLFRVESINRSVRINEITYETAPIHPSRLQLPQIETYANRSK